VRICVECLLNTILVGALILSRAVDDPALSDEILEATATELGRR